MSHPRRNIQRRKNRAKREITWRIKRVWVEILEVATLYRNEDGKYVFDWHD